jgi:hypothetical protein
MSDTKSPRFKRKRDTSQKAVEAGVKSAQAVFAKVLEKADPKAAPSKPR